MRFFCVYMFYQKVFLEVVSLCDNHGLEWITEWETSARLTIPNFILTGFLSHSSDDDTLQPGTKLELPFWLARSLCSQRRHIVSVEMPKVYRENYRQILKADPNVVDLHKLGPFFYGFGSYLLSFQHADAVDIANILVKVGTGHHLSSRGQLLNS